MVTCLPFFVITAPNKATDLRVGALSTIGSLSSGGTHIRYRVPCCWKWHSSKLHKSISSFLARMRSFFIFLLSVRICLCNYWPGFPLTKSHLSLSKNTLALTCSYLNSVFIAKMMRKYLTIPKILAIAKLARLLSQICLKLHPNRFIHSLRPSRPFFFIQSSKTSIIKTTYLPLNSSRILTKQLCNFTATIPLANQEVPVKTVIITRLFRTSDFLLDSYTHNVLIKYFEFLHICPSFVKVNMIKKIT